MATGQFREDLFYRLSVFPIHLPPLRDRREDVPALADHFLKQTRLPAGADTHLTADVLEELASRPWTGNVRELRNTIEHAAIVARGRTICREHLPKPAVGPSGTATATQDAIGTHLAAWARRETHERRAQGGEANLHERFLALTEPHLLRAVLNACRNNRAQAAEMLGIHRATLRQKLSKYGID
jgi:two-component system nitrogen regulation response regulator GlnG